MRVRGCDIILWQVDFKVDAQAAAAQLWHATGGSCRGHGKPLTVCGVCWLGSGATWCGRASAVWLNRRTHPTVARHCRVQDRLGLRLSYCVEQPAVCVELPSCTHQPVSSAPGGCFHDSASSTAASCTFDCPSQNCLLYTSPSPRDATLSRMPSSA